MSQRQHDPGKDGTEPSGQDTKTDKKSVSRRNQNLDLNLLMSAFSFLETSDLPAVLAVSKSWSALVNIPLLKRLMDLPAPGKQIGPLSVQYYQELLQNPKVIEKLKKITEDYVLRSDKDSRLTQSKGPQAVATNPKLLLNSKVQLPPSTQGKLALSFLIQSKNTPALTSLLSFTICFGGLERSDFVATGLAQGLPKTQIPNINSLLEVFGIKDKEMKMETLLTQCFKRNWRGALVALLDRKDINPNAKNKLGEFLLNLAISRLDADTVVMLMKRDDTDFNQIANAHRGIRGTPGSLLLLDMFYAYRAHYYIQPERMEILNLILTNDPEFKYPCPEGESESTWNWVILPVVRPYIESEKKREQFDGIVKAIQMNTDKTDDIAFLQLTLLFKHYLDDKNIKERTPKLSKLILEWLGAISPQSRAHPTILLASEVSSPEKAIRTLPDFLSSKGINFKKFKVLHEFILYAEHHIPLLPPPKLAAEESATQSVSKTKSDKKSDATTQSVDSMSEATFFAASQLERKIDQGAADFKAWQENLIKTMDIKIESFVSGELKEQLNSLKPLMITIRNFIEGLTWETLDQSKIDNLNDLIGRVNNFFNLRQIDPSKSQVEENVTQWLTSIVNTLKESINNKTVQPSLSDDQGIDQEARSTTKFTNSG